MALWAKYAASLTGGSFDEARMLQNVEAYEWLTSALRGLEVPNLDPVYANMRAILLERIRSRSWMAFHMSQMPEGGPRPLLGDFDLQYHEDDPRFWEFDYSLRRLVYTGPVTVWFRFWGSTMAQLVGDFRIGQRLPFDGMWSRSEYAYGHASDDARRSVATSRRGYVPRGRAAKTAGARATHRRRRVHLSESYTDHTPVLHARRYGEASVGSCRYPG